MKHARGRVFLTSFFFSFIVFSGVSVPTVDALEYYPFVQLVFVDGVGDPITTSLDLRVSLWGDFYVLATDVNGDGSLNTSSRNYGNYSDTITVTPQEGYYVDTSGGLYRLDLTALTSFPSSLDYENAFLQVEYKAQGAADTEYVLYDFLEDPPNENISRLDLIYDVRYIAADAGPETIYNTFAIDHNDNAPTAITLQFGGALAETLLFHISNSRFELSDDLAITGGLSATASVDFSSASQFFVPQGSSDPGSCAEGEQFYNTTDDKMKLCTATDTWDPLVSEANLPISQDYVFAYDTTTQSISTEDTFQDITFDTNAQLDGWTHSAGTAAFTAPETGMYQVYIHVSIAKNSYGSAVAEIRATFNGSEVLGSQASRYVAGRDIVGSFSSSFLLNATAGQDLKIQFAGDSTSIKLDSDSTGAMVGARPTIQMTIIRLN